MSQNQYQVLRKSTSYRSINLSYLISNIHTQKVLLFIHGLAEQADHFISLINNFFPDNIKNNYIFLVPDLRGYGHSSSVTPLEFTVDNILEDLQFILKTEDLYNKELVVLGHSMGSFLALDFTLKYCVTLKIKKVILLGWTDNPNLKIPSIFKTIMPKLLSNKSILKRTLLFLGRIPNDKLIRDQIKISIDKSSKSAIRSAFTLLLNNKFFLSHSQLASITIPVLIINGDKDRLASPDSVNVAITDLKNFTFDPISNRGHYIMLVEPQQVADRINVFLSVN